MLFVIDVGNTNTVFGIYDRDKLKANWRMQTSKNNTSDEIGMFFINIGAIFIIFSSVIIFESLTPSDSRNAISFLFT